MSDIPSYSDYAPSFLPTGGLISLGKFLNHTFGWLVIIAFALAFIFFAFGGLKWIMSGGDKQALASAKAAITYAIIGLVLALLAFIIVRFVGTFFGVNTGLDPSGS